MHIDDTARREALLRLLTRWNAQFGAAITRRQLETQWLRTGLRHGDLALAVGSLQRSGCIEPGAGTTYLLRPRALELLSLPPGRIEESAALVVARAELHRAMQRRRSPRAGHGRRAVD